MTDEIFQGPEVAILFSEETTIGSPITPARDLFFSASATASESKNVQVKHGQGTAAPKQVEGKYTVSGSISGSMQSSEILEYIIGPDVPSGVADPYTHTCAAAGDSVPSITIQYGLDGTGDICNTYAGCFVTNVEITATEEGPAEIKMDWVGMTSTSGTTTVAASVDTHALFSMAQCTLTIGTLVTFVENVSFKITRAAEVAHGLGSLAAVGMKPGNWDCEVSFTAKVANTTQIQAFLGSTTPAAQTAASVVLVLDNGVTGAGQEKLTLTATGSIYDSFDLDFGTDKYATFSGTLKGTGVTYVAIDGTANWNA